MTATPGSVRRYPICAEAELAEGQAMEFTLEGRPCFVLRQGGRLYAYHNQCPHLGIALNWQPEAFMDPDGCFIRCANHGALFTPGTGDCITGPCQGDSLMPVDLQVRDGLVEALL